MRRGGLHEKAGGTRSRILCASALDLWQEVLDKKGWIRASRLPSCSGLDSWIVHAWSLKNKELFQIGLVDHPRVEP